jgi:effector-binding domain-containing protein
MVPFWIAGAGLAAVAGAAAWLFRPAKFRVERSIDVRAPAEKVFDSLEDFEQWKAWSPWLCMEPGAQVQIQGKGSGASYAWDGDIIGKGTLTHRGLQRPVRLRQSIQFAKPFRSSAEVGFELAEAGGQTTVSWRLDGRMPAIFGRFMNAWIGMDYERGLRMLKEYLETGRVNSTCEVKGIVNRPKTFYVGRDHACRIDDLGRAMERAFPALMDAMRNAGIVTAGAPFSIYRKFDLNRRECAFTVALPMAQEIPAGTKWPTGYKPGTMIEHRAFLVEHRGSYEHLGNAWSTGMQHLRMSKSKAMKLRQRLPPYEVYIKDPQSVPSTAIVTQIHWPICG